MSRRISPVIPGFGLTLGYTLVYLSLIVLIPLAAMFVHAAQLTWDQFWAIISAPRVLAALKLSFGTAFVAALINGVIGTVLAWVLVRYTFPGRKVIDAMIDLPFALPTAVAGIALTALYAPNGWIGQFAADLGFKIAYTPMGITLALTFVTLPFVVRTVQPVLADIQRLARLQLHANPEHQRHGNNRRQEVRADLRVFGTHYRTVQQHPKQEGRRRQLRYAIRHRAVQIPLMQAIHRQHQSNNRENRKRHHRAEQRGERTVD